MKNIWSNFTEYIIKNYHNAQLIVEVGVGMVFDPSIILKENYSFHYRIILKCRMLFLPLYPELKYPYLSIHF